MIKLARGENIIDYGTVPVSVRGYKTPDPVARGDQLELHGLDDVTASAFGQAKVQIVHGPGGAVPPPFGARVYLREANRFSYARIREYIEEKPPMTFIAWCLAFQLLRPAHVFSALSSHSSNVDPSDMIELLSVLADFYIHDGTLPQTY